MQRSRKIPAELWDKAFENTLTESDLTQISDVNAYSTNGTTLLHFAASNGNVKITQALLAKGANPTLPEKNKPLETYLPIHYALMNDDPNSTDLVNVLLNHPSATEQINMSSNINDDVVPLFMAVKKNDLQLVKIMLEKGANPNDDRSELEMCILARAVLVGNSEIVKLLLKKGADPVAPANKIGEYISPWDMALYLGDPKMIAVFQPYIDDLPKDRFIDRMPVAPSTAGHKNLSKGDQWYGDIHISQINHVVSLLDPRCVSLSYNYSTSIDFKIGPDVRKILWAPNILEINRSVEDHRKQGLLGYQETLKKEVIKLLSQRNDPNQPLTISMVIPIRKHFISCSFNTNGEIFYANSLAGYNAEEKEIIAGIKAGLREKLPGVQPKEPLILKPDLIYELLPVSYHRKNFEPKPGKIYLNDTTSGLQYGTLDPNGNFKNNIIPWDKFPEDARTSVAILESKVKFLPIIMEYTVKAGHSPRYNNSTDNRFQQPDSGSCGAVAMRIAQSVNAELSFAEQSNSLKTIMAKNSDKNNIFELRCNHERLRRLYSVCEMLDSTHSKDNKKVLNLVRSVNDHYIHPQVGAPRAASGATALPNQGPRFFSRELTHSNENTPKKIVESLVEKLRKLGDTNNIIRALQLHLRTTDENKFLQGILTTLKEVQGENQYYFPNPEKRESIINIVNVHISQLEAMKPESRSGPLTRQ